jgi:glycyl-tRNA synthetase
VDIVGIDGSIITHPSIWKASGNVDSFFDLEVICKNCKNKSKVDKHELETTQCEKCGGQWESKGEFNPMFTTQVGPIKEDSSLVYLRPETAQLIFANFKQITDTTRLKLPFGIAQIGKSFRNEIAPRNFLFRCREFEQMEIEYFIDPEKKNDCPYKIPELEVSVYSVEMQEKNQEAKKMKISEALKKKIILLPWHAYWLSTELSWFKSLGVNMENFRIRQHVKDEKSHYATDTWDIEYNFPFGFKELQGIADRGIFDLTQHQKVSKKNLEMRNEESGKKFLPMVISEPSLGVERAFLVFLFDAYTKNQKEEVILKLNQKLSPVKIAIFPLIKKDEQQNGIAKDIYIELRREWNVNYDDSGSVGRRYARNDEIGTPYCITVDEETKKDKSVTIRDRNTTKQIRVPIFKVKETIRSLLSQEIEFEKSGKLI